MEIKSNSLRFILCMFALSFLACDEAEDLLELRINDIFTETINVNLTDDSMGQPQSFIEAVTLDISENPEIEEYLDLIEDVTINSLTYEIDNYNGIDNGTVTEASLTFNNQSIAVNDINLESSDANNVVYEIENTELLLAIGQELESNNQVTIGLSGTVNATPVQFEVIIRLNTTVTADLL